MKNFNEIIDSLKESSPIIHHITNKVTIESSANITLAIGASPIMAEDLEEVEEIQVISKALLLNTGTLNSLSIDSMIKASQKAKELNHPVLLDPVGVGASGLRNRSVKRIFNEGHVDIIKGNLSEISYLAGISSKTKGVDLAEEDQSLDPVQVAKKLSREKKNVVAITGKEDIVTDGKRIYKIKNGHSFLTRITGAGCMASSLIASLMPFCSPVEAAVYGMAIMGLCGERAYEKKGREGIGSFRIALMDEAGKIEGKDGKEFIIEESRL